VASGTLREAGKHALWGYSNSTAYLNELDDFDSPLARFVFSDKGLVSPETARYLLLRQSGVLPRFNQPLQQLPVLRASQGFQISALV
jgi:hypothetical protein